MPRTVQYENKPSTHKRIIKHWLAHGRVNKDAAESLDPPMASSTWTRYKQLALKWAKTTDGKAWLKASGLSISKDGIKVSAPEIQLRELQSTITQLRRRVVQMDAEAVTTSHIRETIFGLREYEPTTPNWVNDGGSGSHTHGIPTLMLSDLHIGEIVYPEQVFYSNEYNIDIAQRRIFHTVDTAIYLLTDVLKAAKFPGIVLILGGDCVSGSIHDELVAGSNRQIMGQVTDATDILNSAILKLVKHFAKVFVVGVPGNHGRTTRKPWAKFYAETNCDWVIYQMLERMLLPQVLAGDVVFNCPAARDLTYKVAGRPFRLTHGDQFRGGDGIIGPLGPITRGDKKKRAMAMTLPHAGEQYETLILGHFHTLHQDARRIINGSTKGYDEYALSNNFEWEPPQQALFLTHNRYGINHMMPVLCEEPVETTREPAWVEYQSTPDDDHPLKRFASGVEWAGKPVTKKGIGK